jgi:hypothetical protein
VAGVTIPADHHLRQGQDRWGHHIEFDEHNAPNVAKKILMKESKTL